MTKLESAFDLFVQKQDIDPEEVKLLLQNPFEINDIVCATDASAVIFCDKKYCDFQVNNEHPPLPFEIPEPNIHKKLNIDSSMFEEYKTKDEWIWAGEDIECSICEGKGKVLWTFRDFEEMNECPVCYGYGLESERQEQYTGNKTFGNFAICIDGTYFDVALLNKATKAQELLGGDIIITHLSEKRLVLEIGCCKVLIMAVVIPNENCVDSIWRISLNN